MKTVKPLDIVTIVIVAIVSLWFILFIWNRGGKTSVVHIDTPNAAYEYSIDKNQTVSVEGLHGITVIEIKNKSIRFIESACPGKTCVAAGSVSRANVPIVCLPNRVSAYITGKEEFDDISGGN